MRFAFATIAKQESPKNHGMLQIETYHYLGILEATTEDEALGKALRLAKKTLPQSSGWFGHQVAVISCDETPVDVETAQIS